MLKIKAGKSTPEVIISIEDCIFKIKGNSFSNDIDNFYQPVLNYIDDNFNELKCDLNCEFYLNVFNSVTYKYVLNIISKFLQFNNNGKKISVTWFYEKDDDDNRESAQDMSDLFNIPFTLKEI